jgi:manganese transport protein
MGEFVNPRWLKRMAWAIAFIITALNFWLLIQVFEGDAVAKSSIYSEL